MKTTDIERFSRDREVAAAHTRLLFNRYSKDAAPVLQLGAAIWFEARAAYLNAVKISL